MKLNEMEIEEDQRVSLSLSWENDVSESGLWSLSCIFSLICWMGMAYIMDVLLIITKVVNFLWPSFPSWNIILTLTCFWSSEKTGSSTLLAITRSMGLRSQPSSWALMGSLWVEVVAGVVVGVVVVLLGWNNSSIKAWNIYGQIENQENQTK